MKTEIQMVSGPTFSNMKIGRNVCVYVCVGGLLNMFLLLNINLITHQILLFYNMLGFG